MQASARSPVGPMRGLADARDTVGNCQLFEEITCKLFSNSTDALTLGTTDASPPSVGIFR